MEFRLIFIVLVLLYIGPTLFAQSEDGDLSGIEKIYENLQYKTIAFDDLKKNWLIKDHLLTREIFNRFVVNSAIYKDGIRLKLDAIRELAEYIYKDKAYVELVQRYYDKEIESLYFFSEDQLDKKNDERAYLFDPLKDCVYIRQVLGERVYKIIKDRTYDINDYTKEYYGSTIDYSHR